MHIEVLDRQRLDCLRALAAMPELSGFYLAGGTGLSLQLGLRVSVDFDFFSRERFNSDAVCAAIRERFKDIHVIHLDADTCIMTVNGAQLSLMYYPYPLLRPPLQDDGDVPGLSLASVEDIAVMKLSAIGGRGARKDFYDLYQIYHQCPSFNGKRLLNCAKEKFGPDVDLNYMLMGLSFFDDAEAEILPKLFVPADWDDIKRFFIQEQQQLFALYEASYRSDWEHLESP